ncbi:MAG TPA: hypothetical protein VHB46_05120 [Burkholderiales bacterium]|nr:hypothetical protein [Burkholderiales bacterium]
MIRNAVATGIVLCAMLPLSAGAHDLSRTECAEGGEFIRNAALARDAGITREFFVGKLAEDLMLIQSFPPQLRWFVQDVGDEKLLSDAVFKVFDEPGPAEQHEAAFLGACLSLTAT